MIRLADPAITPEDVAAVSRVLETGYLVQGPTVEAFERAFADRVGTEYAVAVSSGTSALFLTLRALGIGPGDAVIVSAFSWPATANVVALCGAEPVFADIEPRGWNVDPERVAALLERHPNVKALLPVDGFGLMADLPALAALADRYEVTLIEDAACAAGATLDGRPAGRWGAAGCFSFHPRKILTTGEGGLVTTDDAELARRLRMLRNHGLDPDAAVPDFVTPGYNQRMTEFQAAMGLSRLGRVGEQITRHREIAAWYAEDLPTEVTEPYDPGDGSHVYQSYVVLLPPAHAAHRDQVMASMRTAGVETTIGTYHIPLTGYFRREGGHREGDFPIADQVAPCALALPMHASLSRDDVQTVATALRTALAATHVGEVSS